MTSRLTKNPRESQKRTTWVECKCHSEVTRPAQRLKENAQPKKEGADPTSFHPSFLNPQIWWLTHGFCLTHVPAAQLLTELPVDAPWHGETGYLEATWASTQLLTPFSSWMPLRRWCNGLKKFCLLKKRAPGQDFVWKLPFALAEFGTNVWLKPNTIKLIEQL